MKKLIQIIIFIITFALILVLDFFIYKNIDKVIPTHQNELLTYENKTSKQKYNFIYEMAIQIEEANYKRIIDNNIFAEQNPVISKIISNYIYEPEIISYIQLYEGDLENTIYGNLKFVTSRDYYEYKNEKAVYTNFYIVYSEDMKKICYYNFDNSKGLEPNDYSVKIKEEIYPNAQSTLYDYSEDNIEDYNEEKNSAEAVKNKEELIKSVKDEISKINLNIDIEPNTILKKTDFYIFQDEENKVTIYYDNDNNVIFGLCIGFEY